jgi:hypothetical protein
MTNIIIFEIEEPFTVLLDGVSGSDKAESRQGDQ